MTDTTIQQTIDRAKFLEELLRYYGLTLMAFDPGVAAWKPEDLPYQPSYAFSAEMWEWLKPLLVELRERRELYLAKKAKS